MKNFFQFAVLSATLFLGSCGFGFDDGTVPDIPIKIWELSQDSTEAYCTVQYSQVWDNTSDKKEWLPIYHTVNVAVLAASLTAITDTTGESTGLDGTAITPDLGEDKGQYFVATEQ